MSSEEKFDVIIVGAGLAGITCALVCARAGLSVVVFERGEYPGSKNLSGGIIYTPVINELLPNFFEVAPLERPVIKRAFAFLSKDSSLKIEMSFREFAEPPFNHSFTVLRGKFDRWYASKAEEEGAFIINETVVDDVIWRNGRVVGVKVRREEGEVYGDVVVIAEGANSFLTERMGLRKPFTPDEMVTAAKEVWSLPAQTIEERFCLEPGDGISMECLGTGACMGMVGGGFIYTNKDSISIGIGVNIGDLLREKVTPYNILDYFKSHPDIKGILAGAKLEEYSAHMIPEYGYKKFFKYYGNGYLVVGDAAGFINTSLYHEGTNYATASGKCAAETIIEAKEKGDFSEATLSSYHLRLKNSFVLPDMKMFKDVSSFIHKHREFLGVYPDALITLARSYFTVRGEAKEKYLRQMASEFRKKVPLVKAGIASLGLMKKVLGIDPKWFLFPPKG